MIYYLSLAVLGPVFKLQGRHVRNVTPRLPEAAGARSGVSGQGSPLRLLITGDSAAAGVGADHQQQALSGQLVGELGANHLVNWQLLAKTGNTSGMLLKSLQHCPQAEFDVAVISIGVNDVTAMTSDRRWHSNLMQTITLLRQKFSCQDIYLTAIPPMHRFPALPNPLRWWLGMRARMLNRLMKSLAAAENNVYFFEVPFAGDLNEMANDGFHPGPLAYKKWGARVAELILQNWKAPEQSD